ncbi:MAG: GDSL-type esterase/lipase family protein [Eubacteriales bacterium]
MILKPNDSLIRYTGRWDVSEAEAVSTANGSYAEFAFSGETAVLEFGVDGCRVPFPRIYLSVDRGACVEVPLDRFIRVSAADGEHCVQIILKGSVETQRRWIAPLEAKTAIRSLEADAFLPLPPDNRKSIEFLGDSITEGISIDVEPRYVHYGSNLDMVFWDDATAGYAWLTAKELDMRPVLMGYGCLGTTQGGAGDIPKVCESYPYYSDGRPMESVHADYIVINHGTNDRRAAPAVFFRQYFRLLELVRERSSDSRILALTPFCGAWAKEIAEIVRQFNKERGDGVLCVDTTGWISPEPLHPTREGHKAVSRKLAEKIREWETCDLEEKDTIEKQP